MEDICGPGVDPSFDQLICALGHIVRQKPKPLIDTLMIWRKSKSEAANTVRAEASQANLVSKKGPFFMPVLSIESHRWTPLTWLISTGREMRTRPVVAYYPAEILNPCTRSRR